MKLNKKRAFTLAEVLITLGVTGVLILLLVSSFRANSMTAWHKSNDYKTGIVKYDKVYNAINLSFTNQALKNAGFFKDNKETVLNTALDSLNSTCSGVGCNFTGVSGTTDTYKRQLADGTQLSVKVFADNDGNDGGLSDLSYIIYVDTNGDAKPNKIGQDRLPVYIDKNGNVLNVNPKTGKSYIAEAQKKYDEKSYRIPCPSDYEGEIIATKDAKTGLYNYDKTNCIPIVVNCTEDNAKKHFLKLLSQQGITSVNDSLIKISKSENIYKLKYDYNNKSYIANYSLSDDDACSATLTQRDDCVPGGDYWPIYDIDDLNYIRNHLSCNFKLMNDIDLSSVSNWEPIAFDIHGTYDWDYDKYAFRGSFDGQNHFIKNLTIRYLSSGCYRSTGLFGYTKNATITNLFLTNIKITRGVYRAIGGIIGTAKGGTIKNCYTQGSITVDQGLDVGGIVGSCSNILVENSYSSVDVTSNAPSGGLIGYVSNGTIKNCHATGNLSGQAQKGGLIGYVNNATIKNCYATGSVQAKSTVGGLVATSGGLIVENSYASGNVVGSQSCGGLVGGGATIKNSYSIASVTCDCSLGGLSGMSSTIENSYVVGRVYARYPYYVGALSGYYDTTVKNSYWNNETTGRSGACGYRDYSCQNEDNTFGKTTIEMKTASTYADWDTNIWDIKDGDYPKLKNCGAYIEALNR